MNEDFRVIERFPYYFIDREGTIKRRLRTGRPMLIKKDDRGRRTCWLVDSEGRRNECVIEDLVAETFPEETN